ncbi:MULTISPECIES: GTPase [Achromobacter]|uniref:GTPase n=1 Tax=Achromobacter TaxID=222 RepID=UPI0025BE48C5|nr:MULTISPECIES: GTPase [Achromobacter]
MSKEQQFIEEIAKYDYLVEDMEGYLAQLADWRDDLFQALNAKPATIEGLKQASALAREVEALHVQVQACMDEWSRKWGERGPMERLSASFGDKAIFLVFGKVNAGKSSFANFLADRFLEREQAVQYFFLEENHVVDTSERFKEGATETTARIQGVRLGEKLIVLDTPGLHSVTVENGDLTRHFTDSADAVLWLTSSTSPGQVQELDALNRELQSGKPLLPVITRSDRYVVDQVDDQIVSILCNKSPANRAEQESDVKKRTLQKLAQSGFDGVLLREPASISVYAARQDAREDGALAQAGFERLYENLIALTREALAYKRKKAGQLMVHYLDENVLGSLREKVLPQLETLRRLARDAAWSLETDLPRLNSSILAEVASGLPGILEAHKTTQDIKAVYRGVSELSAKVMAEHLQPALSDYSAAMNDVIADMQPDGKAGYEDVSIDFTVHKGAAKKTAASVAAGGAGGWGGGELGALIGSAVLPGVGTVVGAGVGALLGGLLGAWAGSKGGEYFEETEIQRRKVGSSYASLLDALNTDIKKRLPPLIAGVVEECRSSIKAVEREAARLEDIVTTHTKTLVTLKETLQHDSVQAI